MEESKNSDYSRSGNSTYMPNNDAYGYGGNAQYYGGNRAYGNAQYGNNQYGNNQYGNNQYQGGNNQYYGPNDPNQQDEGSSFDVMEWVLRILHYWYLFVISVAIALGIATLQNRKWLPSYYSQATVIIKESSGYGGGNSSNSALLRGFGVGSGYSNVQNQMIMLGSYDLLRRVVDSIPFLDVDYISKGRFKTRNMYRNTPIIITPVEVAPTTYDVLFELTFLPDGRMRINSTNEDLPFTTTARYGDTIKNHLFSAVIMPTSFDKLTNSGKMYFRFRTRDGLAKEFMGHLKMQFVGEGSTILALSMVSETPERDCEFLDKLSEIFLLQNLEQKNEVAENSIAFINQQLENLQISLGSSEGAMTRFRQENKFVDVSSYAGQLMGRITSYDQKSMELRLKETYFDYLINYVQTGIETGAVIAPASLGISEPMLTGLVKELNDLRLKRGELTEKNVYYAKYTKDIENVKVNIHEVVKSMRASLEIEKQDLQRRYSEVEKELANLPTKELEMVAIERNYRIDDNYYTFFLQKRAEAEIQKASNLPDNMILDKARTITSVNPKQKRKNSTTAAAIGLLIPLALIVLSELLNNKVRTPKDVEKLSQFRLIGSLRHARSQNPTLVTTSPRSSYAEMLRSIRTRIEFIVKRKNNMVIAVTSTESGDGKTFLCSNMAALYSSSGKKTLLIDLDIRKPNLHTKLGVANGMGVTNYLIGDCELEDTMVKDTPFEFDLMRAGTIPPNPGELIHSEKLANMISTLRQQYDFIIIDTSPIGLVPDAYAILELADLGLYVIRCLQTNKSFCKQALEQIAEVLDVPEKLQLVLSDIPTEGHRSYGYGYGYGYGSYGYGKRAGYGYGYGRKQSGIRYTYNKYYSRIFRKEDKNSYKYYYDEDV